MNTKRRKHKKHRLRGVPSLEAMLLPELSDSGTVLPQRETREGGDTPRFVFEPPPALRRRIRAFCHDPRIDISYTEFFIRASTAYLNSKGA